MGLIGTTGCARNEPADVPPVIEEQNTKTSQQITQTEPKLIDPDAHHGPVNDEQTAVSIAYTTWIFVYGKEEIDNQKPYVAEFKNGVWSVRGSLPYGAVGGVAEALISQKDGHVIKYSHGE